MSTYILSIDQGTSSTKTLLIDDAGQVVARGSVVLKTYYTSGGYVEQDPDDIYQNVLASVTDCLYDFKSKAGDLEDIKACGISNQRETFILWDETGRPLYDAIVWQCKRSVDICDRLKKEGLEPAIQAKTGLIIDPYFSGTKLLWLYENKTLIKQAIDSGKAYFGTVDTWLLYKLTQGKSYLTDYTNASRTLFFNLTSLAWDTELLCTLKLAKLNLPEPKPSSYLFGESDFNGLFPKRIAITGMIGDSHAAAFGEGCFSPGTAKATMGTGSSILMNIGATIKASQNGMITTVCWSTEDRVDYAFEGVIVTCGATIEWLKNDLGIITDSRQTEAMANAVPDNNGVYLIPAFSGLGAPHWQMNRKASITGLTFDCNKNHLVRAALESISYQVKDVIVAMEKDAGIPLLELMVNGGITANRFIMQFLSDLLGIKIIQIGMPDVSALGAAYIAGLKAGIYKDLDQLKLFKQQKSVIHPGNGNEHIGEWYAGWQAALENGR